MLGDASASPESAFESSPSVGDFGRDRAVLAFERLKMAVGVSSAIIIILWNKGIKERNLKPGFRQTAI